MVAGIAEEGLGSRSEQMMTRRRRRKKRRGKMRLRDEGQGWQIGELSLR